MSGKKGMKVGKPRKNDNRRKIWRSIRVMRTFTISNIAMTIEGVKYGTVRKIIAMLVTHGYIVKTGTYTGGRLGAYQRYRLAREVVSFPETCSRCGEALSFTTCTPEETDKQKSQSESQQAKGGILEVSHDPA